MWNAHHQTHRMSSLRSTLKAVGVSFAHRSVFHSPIEIYIYIHIHIHIYTYIYIYIYIHIYTYIYIYIYIICIQYIYICIIYNYIYMSFIWSSIHEKSGFGNYTQKSTRDFMNATPGFFVPIKPQFLELSSFTNSAKKMWHQRT